MDRAFHDPAWWDSQVVTNGRTARSSDYSPESHRLRLRAIVALVEQLVDVPNAHILDLPCGVGLLNSALAKTPRMYTGVDFSRQALTVCAEGAKAREAVNCLHADLAEPGWVSKIQACAPYDVAVCCGVFCFEALYKHASEAINMVRAVLQLSGISTVLVANFPWLGKQNSYSAGIRCYSMDEVASAAQAKNLQCELRYGYLPHEFIAVFRP